MGDFKRLVVSLGDKKGNDILFENVIFLILNIIFFSLLVVFVNNSSQEALVYEPFYAKQIALLIDGTMPGSEIILDFSKGIEIAQKNKIPLDRIVSEGNNEVTVTLSENDGYKFKHFSTSSAEFEFEGNKLLVKVIRRVGNE